MATTKLDQFPVSETVDCPKCGSPEKLFDPEGSEYFVCSKCRSLARFIATDHAIAKTLVNPLKSEPVIPLGSVGELDGYSFKVTGYLEKFEQANRQYGWREYLLYNYEKGYATLVENDGHWNLVAGAAFHPDLAKLPNNDWTFIEYQNISYDLFNKYTPKVNGFIGEFDWNPLEDKIKSSEFIAPPFMIICEKDGNRGLKAEYYLGRYLQPDEIAVAFNLDAEGLPERLGIGANQFSTAYSRWDNVFTFSGILLVLILVAQLLFVVARPETVLMDQSFTINRDSIDYTDNFSPFITPSFKIKGHSSAIEFTIKSDVDNNWLEANIVLVNERTNQTWEVTEAVEYYHGVEGGETWSEGSRTTTVQLSAIPEGQYHLNVYPASGDPFRDSVNIRVTDNIMSWTNLFLTCFVLMIYPAHCWYSMRAFEKKRWLNSDYSPYEAS